VSNIGGESPHEIVVLSYKIYCRTEMCEYKIVSKIFLEEIMGNSNDRNDGGCFGWIIAFIVFMGFAFHVKGCGG